MYARATLRRSPRKLGHDDRSDFAEDFLRGIAQRLVAVFELGNELAEDAQVKLELALAELRKALVHQVDEVLVNVGDLVEQIVLSVLAVFAHGVTNDTHHRGWQRGA